MQRAAYLEHEAQSGLISRDVVRVLLFPLFEERFSLPARILRGYNGDGSARSAIRGTCDASQPTLLTLTPRYPRLSIASISCSASRAC